MLYGEGRSGVLCNPKYRLYFCSYASWYGLTNSFQVPPFQLATIGQKFILSGFHSFNCSEVTWKSILQELELSIGSVTTCTSLPVDELLSIDCLKSSLRNPPVKLSTSMTALPFPESSSITIGYRFWEYTAERKNEISRLLIINSFKEDYLQKCIHTKQISRRKKVMNFCSLTSFCIALPSPLFPQKWLRIALMDNLECKRKSETVDMLSYMGNDLTPATMHPIDSISEAYLCLLVVGREVVPIDNRGIHKW